MIKLLGKLIIKDDIASEKGRRKYGSLCGFCGIALNVILFIVKFFAGTLTGSVAVTADAFNNISDAGSSAVTLLGFRLAGKKPDPEHPFGHGRIEYVSGLVVALLIFVMGFELILSSIEAIKNPEPVELSAVSLVILSVSILVKLYMFAYNRIYGKKIGSAAMLATASDSVCDAIATSAVLISLIVSHFTNLLIDGYVGLLVAAFIIYSGFGAAKETIEPLLGSRPEKELVDGIEELVISHEQISGIHDLVIHDYGPGRRFLSLHAEIPKDCDVLEIHDVIDNVEIEIYEKYNIEACIHMDPIDTRDERINELKATVKKVLDGIGENLNAHDFRIVPGQTHTNVVFDVVLPAESDLDAEVVKKTVAAAVAAENPAYRCVIKIDRNYA